MASYKVPQDVEAEDKLIGPFSFRQFIYLGVVALSLGAAWGLFLLFQPLVIIPLPIAIFFGALALPLRKDQPMETYLAALWQFYIKPRQRTWMADGVVSRITIDIPLVVERRLIKDLTTDQAISQFDYLADIADTGGWSSRGVTHAPVAVVDKEDDMMDETSAIAQGFDDRLHQEDDQRHEDLLAKIHSGSIVDEAPVQTTIIPMPDYSTHHDKPQDSYAYSEPAPQFDPTPKYMNQHVLQPLDPSHQAQPQAVYHPSVTPNQTSPQSTDEPAIQNVQQPVNTDNQNQPQASVSVATPAIMELAKDVSVETLRKTIQHEEVERESDGSVLINLH